MTQEEFSRIVIFMKNRYGIDLSRKKEIVEGRLGYYVQKEGFGDYTKYMNAVESDVSGTLEKQLVNLLTTNHTFFMRECEHFEFLKEKVLPWLRKKEEAKKDLCIWCGASSTGEEPYTLAMVLKDFFGFEHTMWDTKVLATDISTDVLEQAVAGIYAREQVEGIPLSWKRRFFKESPDGEFYEVRQEIKEEVIFRQFNLMNPFPFKRKMHIVFLRNVMIYFDNDTKRRLVQKVYDIMEPGGYLFIGRTETLDSNSVPFRLIQPSIFRKEEGKR